MTYYAGIDVSLEYSSVCVVDGAGKIIREQRIASEPEALIAWFRGLGFGLERIGLEAGPMSQWLYAAMRAAGLAVELLETRHVRDAFKAMPVKSDRNDARGIAQLMRLGWFRPVHCKSMAAQEMRALLTARKLVQSKLLDVQMSLRGLLRGFGLKVGATTPLNRVLTDRGTEYCGNPEHHEYELYLAIEDVDHSRTKTKSPQTNGICERFHKTVLNEFYRVAFRKTLYRSIAELQADLDRWVTEYNELRPHQGRWCFGKTPMQTFLDALPIAREKMLPAA